MTSQNWRPRSLNLDKPLYIAIADALEEDVRNETLKPGAKLPPQRVLADIIGVNVSTLTRALRECELRGLLSGTVGRGTFIAPDIQVSTSMTLPENPAAGLLEMGLVYPLYDLDDQVAAATAQLLGAADIGPLLRYSEPGGLTRHREAGAAWLQRFGLHPAPANVLVTAGTQSALTCCLLALFKAGDRIAVDAVTYPGIKSLAAHLGLRLVPVETDAAGMVPEALAVACRREPLRGLFLMPEVQNPTTAALPDERREEIAALIRRHDLILVEDECYGYTGRLGQPALCSLVPERGIYLAGVSKLLGAGFRISYAAVAPGYRSQIEKAILNTLWMASPFSAEIVSRLIGSETGEATLRGKRAEARRRNVLARQKLAAWSMLSRETGLFVWLYLPEEWSGLEFELAARAAGVRVFCAEKFAVGNGPVPRAVRVSLTGPDTVADLDRGLTILAGLLARGPHEIEAIF